jgi:hypothetical protein
MPLSALKGLGNPSIYAVLNQAYLYLDSVTIISCPWQLYPHYHAPETLLSRTQYSTLLLLLLIDGMSVCTEVIRGVGPFPTRGPHNLQPALNWRALFVNLAIPGLSLIWQYNLFLVASRWYFL